MAQLAGAWRDHTQPAQLRDDRLNNENTVSPVTPDQLLDQSFALVERLGLPLAIAAWLTVFAGAIALGLILRTTNTEGVWPLALAVGGLGLAAHLLDYFVTLRITPDLALEANPLWRVIIDRFGLSIARAYGLSGKVLLSVISAQLFAWHLSHRTSLFPASVSGPLDFIQQLGRGAPRLGNIRSFFAFAFAWFGPYFFYITAMNVIGALESPWYERLPSPPVAILGYFVVVTAGYFVSMWSAFSRVVSAPHPDLLPARGERERKEVV